MRFHPGYYIREYIEDGYYIFDEIQKALDIDKEILIGILEEKISIDEDLVMKLSRCFGTSKQLWLNLQKIYDDSL